MLQVVATTPAGTRATISYVAERMVLRHNSAVELVTRAERAGLVKRVGDDSDHRRSVVELTDAGRTVFLHLAEIHLQELNRVGPAITEALEKLIGKQVEAGNLTEVAR
ncbi:Transcriptional regulator, MarR family [Granulicella sibirica]|uniref:Transcriptional regulator, MarR family n=2 Tax=Granulicella sibirica TaxID=2479048 RepID=A0A4Q0T269_9BACT|nr:Transcriptional regulator, MarR family [Granulicella sibirica]